MSDILYIHELEIPCRIGTTDQERSRPQPVLISVEISCDLRKAGLSDDLKDALDYAALAEDIRVSVQAREFNLMEAVAESIAALILKKYRPASVQVTIEKKIFPGVKGAGVIIRRPQ